jgi:hypothetical protein
LVNLRYDRLIELKQNAPIFSGSYSDFTSDWYREVGGVIASATFVAAIFPVIEIGFMFISLGRRFFDRRCSKNPEKTKQLLQKDYENIYTGEEFGIASLYAILIAQVMIVMTYSAAMPLLYLSLPLFCFMMYWTEKYLFLRHHKNVPLYDTHIV